MKINLIVFLVIILGSFIIGALLGKDTWQRITSPTKENIQHNMDMLQKTKDMLIDAYVPDSLKQASRDASYTLMYAEPDGNDYWSSRGAIHQTEANIKTCVPCMYIDSLLQAKENEFKELQN